MQIDIGFGDIIFPAPVEMDYPTLLDMESPVIKAYSIESLVSEKFEAMIDLSELNSRMKDFYDVFRILSKGNFDKNNLKIAIAQVIQKVDAKVIDIRKEQNKPPGASYDLLHKEIHILFRKKEDEPNGFLFVRQNLKYIKNILEVAKRDKVQFSTSDVIKLGIIIQPILQGDKAVLFP